MKSAEIISVGEELLAGLILDSNAQAIGALLQELGIRHTHRQTVGDTIDDIGGAVTLALSRADIVFTIGGLGPTTDDLTREGIAQGLGVALVFDEAFGELLQRMAAQRKVRWLESLARQAWRPRSAEFIDNPNGSAPGLWCAKDGKVLIAMPGPKNEFGPMLQGPVRERLLAYGQGGIATCLLKICELGESMVEELLGDLMPGTNPTVAPYAKQGEVHLKITAHAEGPAAAQALLAPVERQVRSLLGDRIFEDTLEAEILRLLEGSSLATAESITGGGLSQRITNVPGVSEVFRTGFVTYTPDSKTENLGIDPNLIAEHTPVSAEVASAMAEGCRARTGAEWGLSTTGNAGPTADVGGKPIGLVFIGISGPGGTRTEEFRFRGNRETIRQRAEQAALTTLRRSILDFRNPIPG